MLAKEVPLPLAVHTGQVDRALALDEADHLRYRMLRRDRNQHVDVIVHQMHLFNLALLLRGQQVAPQVLVQCAAAALPLGVA